MSVEGYNGGTPLSLVERFSPGRGHMGGASQPDDSTEAPGAVRAGESVYVLGGFDGTTSTSAVERLGVTGTWKKCRRFHVGASGVSLPL